MEARAFVLLPLAEIAPAWRHPQSGVGVAELIAGLPSDAICRPLPEPSP
jgi:2-amino-4-hydroxy-6-hydroxymethyldihydropteridine diphosphokinase